MRSVKNMTRARRIPAKCGRIYISPHAGFSLSPSRQVPRFTIATGPNITSGVAQAVQEVLPKYGYSVVTVREIFQSETLRLRLEPNFEAQACILARPA